MRTIQFKLFGRVIAEVTDSGSKSLVEELRELISDNIDPVDEHFDRLRTTDESERLVLGPELFDDH